MKVIKKCILILQSGNDGITEGHGKFSIAPLFQSGAILILSEISALSGA